jgi:hypothetical protein
LDYPGKSNANNHHLISSFALMVIEKMPMYHRIGSSSFFLTTWQEKRGGGGDAVLVPLVEVLSLEGCMSLVGC